MKYFFMSNDKKLGKVFFEALDKDSFGHSFQVENECSLQYTDCKGNYLTFQNGDFIVMLGTGIYKTKHSLKKIYQDFNPDKLNNLRKNLVGNYAIILLKGKKIHVFSDCNSVYKLYYAMNKRGLMISNMYYKLSQLLPKAEIDNHNLIQDSFVYSILNNETIFKDIHILKGSQVIVWDVVKGDFNIKSVDRGKVEKPPLGDLEMCSKALACMIKKKARIIAKNYPRIGLNMTGGLDSRLVLASFLSVGVKPTLLYGIGNSELAYTQNKDFELVKEYAKKFDLKLQTMDWHVKKNFDADWDFLLSRYGESFKLYGGLRSMFEEYEKISKNVDYIDFGYFGEMLRNLDWLEDFSEEKLELDKLMAGYFFYEFSMFLCDPESFLEEYGTHIRSILNLDVGEKLTKDEFSNFHLQYRYSADTKMVNLANLFSNSSILLSDPEIQDFIKRIPFDYKKNMKFMLRVIYHIYPEVLEIPIFSHNHPWVFNKNAFTLEKTFLSGSYYALLKTLRKNKRVFDFLKKARGTVLPHMIQNKELDEAYGANIIKQYSVNEIEKLQEKLDLYLVDAKKFYHEDPRPLVNYYGNLFMILKFKSPEHVSVLSFK